MRVEDARTRSRKRDSGHQPDRRQTEEGEEEEEREHEGGTSSSAYQTDQEVGRLPKVGMWRNTAAHQCPPHQWGQLNCDIEHNIHSTAWRDHACLLVRYSVQSEGTQII